MCLFIFNGHPIQFVTGKAMNLTTNHFKPAADGQN